MSPGRQLKSSKVAHLTTQKSQAVKHCNRPQMGSLAERDLTKWPSALCNPNRFLLVSSECRVWLVARRAPAVQTLALAVAGSFQLAEDPFAK